MEYGNLPERMNSFTPLQLAVMHKRVDICRLLLEKEVDIEAYGVDGPWLSCLNLVVHERNLEIIQLLLENNAKVEIENDDGENILQWISCDQEPAHSRDKVGELILQYGGNVNKENNDGFTQLHNAADINDYPYCKTLLEFGANINAVSKCGNTPLHMARSYDIYILFLDKGADPTLQNEDGNTALHFAAAAYHKPCCQLLVELGGMHLVHIKNNNNDKPSDVAKNDEIRDYLKSIEDLKSIEEGNDT